MIKLNRLSPYLFICLSVAFHLSLILIWAAYEGFIPVKPKDKNLDVIEVQLEEPIAKNNSDLNASFSSDKQLASLPVPSAPTAQEWAFASKYTLKNSKGYRHSFGQQVRSMMGVPLEAPDQGHVRFMIEIAPNGSIAKVETLWKTSDKAEQLARKAINSMPALPPTPTGQVLIFERTISFTTYASNDAPIYRDDCLPDPPSFSNPFAWDGKSPQVIKQNEATKKLSHEALAECLKQLPSDSVDGVAAHNQRQFDQWRSSKFNQQ